MALDKLIIEKIAQLDSNFNTYVPQKVCSRLMGLKESFVTEMKAKISERILKKEHNVIFEMKLALLGIFSRFPEFMSSNHRMRSK